MTKKQVLLSYSAFIGLIILLAYLGLIPTKLHDIPYYDSAGHFILYGLWGYFFGNAYQKPMIAIGRLIVQNGIAMAIIIAIIEESLQQLSPMRTFSLADLGFGLLGITTACAILNLKKHGRTVNN
jgi:hypothetical protein